MNRIVSAPSKWFSVVVAVFRISPLFRVLVCIQVVLLVLIVAGYVFTGTTNISYSFAEKTVCARTIVALPKLQKVQTTTFSVQLSGEKKLFGYPIIATTACVTPGQKPVENTKTVASLPLLPGGLFAKRVVVATGGYPQLTKQLTSLAVVSVHDPLVLGLTAPDKTFTYVLTANENSVTCTPGDNAQSIRCDPTTLQLKHAAKYSFTLARVFGTVEKLKADSVVSSASIQTVTPVAVTATSIGPGALVYSKPQTIQITVDKPIASVKDVQLSDGSGTTIPTTITTADKTVTVAFTPELARGKTHVLRIGNIVSTDSGSFIQPYELSFTPAKGPRVSGVNIGASGVGLGQNIVLNFDQPFQTSDIAKHISLTDGNGAVLASTVSASGSTLTINPVANFGKCSRFKITVDSGVVSPYGIGGESAWSYMSRASCFDSFSIGTSVKGRSITAYKIGSGAAILYVGGIHGNEQNATKILQKWIAELDANPDKIPINRSIVVIPSASPDGYAQNSRTNANGINLNRNFPANNWKADVKEPSGKVLVNGGGASALDQPESAALAGYVQALKPVMIMSYHSSGGVAVSNDAGNSRALADAYAKKTGYAYKNNDTIGNFFDYDTTGAFEDWAHDKQNTPLILVELYSKYDDEFNRNKPGLWFIAQSVNF